MCLQETLFCSAIHGIRTRPSWVWSFVQVTLDWWFRCWKKQPFIAIYSGYIRWSLSNNWLGSTTIVLSLHLKVPLLTCSIIVISISALVGVDFKLKLMSLKGKKLKLTIWDTGACHFIYIYCSFLSMSRVWVCIFAHSSDAFVISFSIRHYFKNAFSRLHLFIMIASFSMIF
mgnify:CR=1 FL=1